LQAAGHQDLPYSFHVTKETPMFVSGIRVHSCGCAHMPNPLRRKVPATSPLSRFPTPSSPLSLVQELLERSRNLRGLALLSLNLTQLLLGEGGSIGVEAQHDLLVAQRVLLLDAGALGTGLTLRSTEHALDFSAVDETAEIGLADNVGRQEEALLALVDGIELLDGGRGPDDEAAEVATRSKLEEVEGIDRAGLDTRDVAEALDELLAVMFGAVNDERTAALAVAAAPHLTLTGAELLGLLNLLNIRAGTDGLEELVGSSSLGNSVASDGSRVDDQRNLRDGRNLVATGHQERSHGRGGEGRSGSKAPVIRSETVLPKAASLFKTYFWPWLILTCHLRQILVGANMRPERHMLPKAPWPAR